MKWVDVAADARAVPLEVLTRNLTAIEALKLLALSVEYPLVLLSVSVRSAVESHLASKSTELGGLLIGRVYSGIYLKQGVAAIEVRESVSCEAFDSTAVSLSMSAGVWTKANGKASPGEHVVGWYHSHPNLGAFFSGTDRRTQRDFFGHPYGLGLVIDPVRREEKWFLGEGSRELPAYCVSSLEVAR